MSTEGLCFRWCNPHSFVKSKSGQIILCFRKITMAEGPGWESGIRSAPGVPNRWRATRAEPAPGTPGTPAPDLTFGHVAREPTRHVATIQRKALPPGGPGGSTQRARAQPHGA